MKRYTLIFTLDGVVEFNAENDEDALEFVEKVSKSPTSLIKSSEYEHAVDLDMRDDYELMEQQPFDMWGRIVRG